MLSFLFSAVIVLGCAGAEGLSAGNEEKSELEIVRIKLSGLRPSGVPAGEYVFNDAERWEEFRSKFHKASAPEIDFEKYTLVAVFLGQRPNPGYSVKLVGAAERREATVVRVVEYLPSPGMMYAQVIAYPYDAALIPKAGKPIRFETSKKTGRP